MNEEIDESEFYHQDFTTASEWEIFIARLEEILHGWKINDGSNDNGDEWSMKSDCVPFADVEFTLTYYRKGAKHVEKLADLEELGDKHEKNVEKNPLEGNRDFTLKTSTELDPDINLSIWYGFDEFIVLKTTGNSSLVSESRIKVALSSLNVVAVNEKVPLFLQIREKWQNCYLGVHEGDGIRTNFEMIHLRRGPQHSQHLSGLAELFKAKIMSPASLDTIDVCHQLTYQLTDYGAFTWKQDYTDAESFNLFTLPVGVTIDPIASIILKTSWLHIPDTLLFDTETYSTFNPLQAQKWSVHVEFNRTPICLLSDLLTDFLNVGGNVSDLLGDFSSVTGFESNPLDLLTESKVPTISNVLKRAARSSLPKTRKGSAPLTEETLVPILYFLFPDAVEESEYLYETKEKDDETYRNFKTCKPDSLVWRLAIVLAHSSHSLGGNRAMAHLWYEFVHEMRYRWEKTVSIPGLSQGYPDPRTCLLHQKLQLLNCCIERRRSRETAALEKSGEYHAASASLPEESDEEEFFDCSDEADRKCSNPVGRLAKFEDLKLLKTGDPLYVPITQEPIPKTEDQLEEDTDILIKLGSGVEGSELRARMMSASLISDMESFKAANPGAILEDFIRWYSPRDWIETEGFDQFGQQNGHLSSRMLIADNTWVKNWGSSLPVAANRQKRLFDDTREAEKILRFLETSRLERIAEMLLPVLGQIAVSRINEENQREKISHLVKLVEKISRSGPISYRLYENFIQEMNNFELKLSQTHSLLYKFNPEGSNDESLNEQVSRLVDGVEIELVDMQKSKIGSKLVGMFKETQKLDVDNRDKQIDSLPAASQREYILRVGAHRPSTYSKKSPQFLRAILNKNEFRLCGAFSEDIVFF